MSKKISKIRLLGGNSFINNVRAAATGVGAVFGLMLTGMVGAYTVPQSISALINATAAGGGIAQTSPVVPILGIVGPIALAIAFIFILLKGAGVMD